MRCCSSIVRERFGKEALFPKRSRTVPEGHPNKTRLSIVFTGDLRGFVMCEPIFDLK